jgi:protein ImuA
MWQPVIMSLSSSLLNSAPAPLDVAMRNVWRASELAVSRATTCSTGQDILDSELPNGGWPRSSLIELLVQQAGIGEMQLLKPTLKQLSANKRVALVQPPYLPQAMTIREWQVNEGNVFWVRPESSADALWSTEQILKNGSCGAVVLWQKDIRTEALRRLNLIAQGADTWLWVIRPLAHCSDASPSPLRLALRPAVGGVSVDIIKRRGPHCDAPIFVPLQGLPAGRQHWDTEHEIDVVRAPALTTARSSAAMLV